MIYDVLQDTDFPKTNLNVSESETLDKATPLKPSRHETKNLDLYFEFLYNSVKNLPPGREISVYGDILDNTLKISDEPFRVAALVVLAKFLPRGAEAFFHRRLREHLQKITKKTLRADLIKILAKNLPAGDEIRARIYLCDFVLNLDDKQLKSEISEIFVDHNFNDDLYSNNNIFQKSAAKILYHLPIMSKAELGQTRDIVASLEEKNPCATHSIKYIMKDINQQQRMNFLI